MREKRHKPRKEAQPFIECNALWVPRNQVYMREVKRLFVLELEDKQVKSKRREDRMYTVETYRLQTVKGVEFIGLPIGDLKRVRRCLLDKFAMKSAIDKRPKLEDVTIKPCKTSIVLRDYQLPAVATFTPTSFRTDRLKQMPSGVLRARPRSGKCVTGETLIPTTQGLIRIDQLVNVPSVNGSTEMEYGVATRSGVLPTSHGHKRTSKTIKVTLSKGYYLEGTPEHPVLVATKRLTQVWKPLSEIEPGDWVCYSRAANVWSEADHKLDHHLLPEAMTPKLARILGYLTANGNLNQAYNKGASFFSFCSQNEAVLKDYLACWRSVFGLRLSVKDELATPEVHVCSVEHRDALAKCGLGFGKAATKTIPESVMRSTKECIQAFLSAYVSCDSYLPDRGQYELCTASEDLARQLHYTLFNAGVVATLGKKDSYARNSANPVVRTYHTLSINGDNRTSLLEFLGNGLLRPHSLPCTKDRADSDVIPFSYQYLGKATHRKHLGAGRYLCKDGTEQVFKLIEHQKPFHCNTPHFTYRAAWKWNIENIAKVSPRAASKAAQVLEADYRYFQVESVELGKKAVPVYDLTVPGEHSFVANGMIVHNTVMGVSISCNTRVKTLVMVHQNDLLVQFKRDTYDKLTEAGQRVKICKTYEDFRDHDYCLVTYQSFLSPRGKKLLRKIRSMFGLVIIDEIHRSASKEYNHVISQINALQYIGLTGTPDRKDGKYDLVNVSIGPIRITCKAPALKPKVQMVTTDLPGKHFGGNGWTYMVKYIATNKARNELIAEHAVKDMLAGHNVVIPITTIEHGNLLEVAISKKWEALGKSLPVCARFDGRLSGTKRDQVLDDIRDGKYKCTIAMRSMLTGVNVPRWSMIYTVIPIANAPTYTQEVTRVGTPMDDKKRPIIKCFLDEEMSACVACFRKMFFAVLNVRADYTVSRRVLRYFNMTGPTIESAGARASSAQSSSRQPSYTRNTQTAARAISAPRAGGLRGFGSR